MDEQIIREKLDLYFAKGDYEACKELLQSGQVVDAKVNDLAVARHMLSVCEQEQTEGRRTLFSKVGSLEELIDRYTQLMFYIRRLEFGIGSEDENISELNHFLEQNRVSPPELLVVLYCSAVHTDRVVQMVKDKMERGDIVL